MKSEKNLAFFEWNQWHAIVWNYNVFFFGFLTRKISQSPRLSLINSATDFSQFFAFGFSPHAFYVRWKNIVKYPQSIMFLECKSVISSKRLQRVERVFSCSYSLLVLYRLISKKSLSPTFTSKVRILPDSFCFLFETSKLVLPM